MSSTNDNESMNAGKLDFSSVIHLSQDEFDLVFFRRLLNENPSNVDAIRRTAELLARDGRHEDALELDKRLAKILKTDRVVRYNLACSYAMTGKLGLAIEALARAIELGYDDFARIESDSDLDSLRMEPAFLQLMEKYDA